MSAGVQMNTYERNVLAARGIPAAAIDAIVARGLGRSIDGGAMQYSHRFTDTHGFSWGCNVIVRNGAVLTSWIERE